VTSGVTVAAKVTTERPVYALAGVGYSYVDAGQSFRALGGVTLTIAQGEFVAIVGASGSGKTTMMNLLGLLSTPTEGTFLLDGEDVADLDEDAKAQTRGESIGFVFQHFALLPRLSVLENVLLPYRFSERLDESLPKGGRCFTLTCAPCAEAGKGQACPLDVEVLGKRGVAHYGSVFDDHAILKDDTPPCSRGHVRVVRDDDDGLSGRVESFEEREHFIGRP